MFGDRYPLRTRAFWALVISFVARAAVFFAAPDVANEIEEMMSGLLDMAIMIGLVKATEPHTTPTIDPKDNAGNTLVPADLPEMTDEPPPWSEPWPTQ